MQWAEENLSPVGGHGAQGLCRIEQVYTGRRRQLGAARKFAFNRQGPS